MIVTVKNVTVGQQKPNILQKLNGTVIYGTQSTFKFNNVYWS